MKSIFALSGDPITFGHINVIKCAAEMFKPLIVAIANNTNKNSKYVFTVEERVNLAKRALEGLDVEVTSFEGLTADFARLNNASVIVRSMRDSIDFNYEKAIHDVNKKLGITTVFLLAEQSMTHISSSAVRELQTYNSDVHEYVPLVVKEALERKISSQYLVGVTGEICAGKSYVTNVMVQEAILRGLSAHNIDFDVIGRKILTELDDPLFAAVRQRLIEKFPDIKLPFTTEVGRIHNMIDISKVRTVIFKKLENVQMYNEIMQEALMLQLRKELNGKKGLIFINCALTAEAGISHLTNNNIVVIKTTATLKMQALKSRGYSDSEIDDRLRSQLPFDEKISLLAKHRAADNYGKLLVFENFANECKAATLLQICCLLDSVIEQFKFRNLPMFTKHNT